MNADKAHSVKLPDDFVPMRMIGAPNGQLPTPEQYAEMYAHEQAWLNLMDRATHQAVVALKRIDPDIGVRQIAYHLEDGITVVVVVIDARDAPIPARDLFGDQAT
jgi:hypothetical protein